MPSRLSPRAFRRARRFLASAAAAAVLAAPAGAQLAPLPYDEGALGLGLALRRLPVAARVLYVTAHPDDEHNGVLVALSRGRGVRTALLTVTRGDGGQNAVGPELFEALGVLRTGELLALHRYDAVEQYFTRAYEFGFSFSVEETLARWGHEETLGDVVRVVRAFRPDVILTLPLEAPEEHAHHLAAARLAREAFRAAADPGRFPEQVRAGLRPWQARKLYQGGVGGDSPGAGAAAVTLPTGTYDALLGLSWQELGSLARAQHRSQGASQLKADPLQGRAAFALVDAEPQVDGPESDVLEGLETTLGGLHRFAPRGSPAEARLEETLLAVEADARAALDAYDVHAPERALAGLRAGLVKLDALQALLNALGLPEDARAELSARLADKREEFAEALRRAHALVLVVVPSDDRVVPGQSFDVAVSAFNQGREPIEVDALALELPAGWSAERQGGDPGPLAAGSTLKASFHVTAAVDARPSQPYWHRTADGGRVDLDVPADESLPWSPPDVRAALRYRSGPVAARVAAPAAFRYEGRAGGEKQKELQVVPALTLRLFPAVALLPLDPPGARRELRVSVTNEAPGPATAALRLEAPAGFAVEPREHALAFRREDEEAVARFTVTAPRGLRAGTYELRAVARSAGREYRAGDQVVAYDHVEERRLYRPAAARAIALEVAVRPGVALAYVPGVGDELPAALGQLGLAVHVLDPEELATGDLARFTTILLGVRAYTDRDVRAQHARLMAFVEAGGHLVVQYQRGEFNQLSAATRAVMGAGLRPDATPPDSPFAPYPAAVTTRRVSDETAPVRLLVPDHPLLSVPNRLGPADWQGWVQERGLQLLEARDARYVELVSSEDPFPRNPGEKKGLLVEARVGRGTWTYVGLGLFRQLPAGTPGAYRLLANLVSRPRGQ